MNDDFDSWRSPNSELEKFEAQLSHLRPVPVDDGAAQMLLAAGYAQGQRDQTRSGHGAQRWLAIAACTCLLAGFGGYRIGHQNGLSQVAVPTSEDKPDDPPIKEHLVSEPSLELVDEHVDSANQIDEIAPPTNAVPTAAIASYAPARSIRLRVRTVDFDWESYAFASSAFDARPGRSVATPNQLTPRSEFDVERTY